MSKLILVSLTLVWCLGVLVEGFTYDDKEVTTEEGKSAMFERWRSHHQMEKGMMEVWCLQAVLIQFCHSLSLTDLVLPLMLTPPGSQDDSD